MGNLPKNPNYTHTPFSFFFVSCAPPPPYFIFLPPPSLYSLRHCERVSHQGSRRRRRRRSPSPTCLLLLPPYSFSLFFLTFFDVFPAKQRRVRRRAAVEEVKLWPFLHFLSYASCWCWLLIVSSSLLISFRPPLLWHFPASFPATASSFGTCKLGFNFVGELSLQPSLFSAILGEMWVKGQTEFWGFCLLIGRSWNIRFFSYCFEWKI